MAPLETDPWSMLRLLQDSRESKKRISEGLIMTEWKWLEQGGFRGYCEKWGAKSAPFLESSNEQDLGLFNLCIEAS